MIHKEDCEFLQLRSFDDEAGFFAQMGRFFASATTRRECGGYPLSDGPRHRWFVIRHKPQERVLGFISIEQEERIVRIRDGYLRAEARGCGLFRELRTQVLAYVDAHGLACTLRMPQRCAGFLMPHGFEIESIRGNWVTLRRSAHAVSGKPDQSGESPVPRIGRPVVRPPGRSHQSNTPGIA